MKMSQRGLELLKEWEGCILHVYKDAAGLDTIGIGHLITGGEKKTGILTIGGEPVRYAAGITMEQALGLLARDVAPAERAVASRVKIPLAQHQFDALVSFTFNCGEGALAGSTLLKVLNDGHHDQVPDQLARWTRAAGKVCDGLVTRRANEIKLWRGEL